VLILAARDGRRMAVLLLHLDGLEAVNDEHGHAAGDELLRWTASTAAAALRPRDIVGRVGGDGFAVVLPGADPGAATFPADGTDRDAVMRCADRRLSREKRKAQANGAADESRVVRGAS
jgi:GGDEF domain-containing protein